MSTESPQSKPSPLRWLHVLLALLIGVGIGVPVGHFAFPRAADPSVPELQLFEQTGSFESGAAGEVHFPSPYAYPPNVELKWRIGPIKVVETTPTGFKWADFSNPPQGEGGTWTAKGIKATK